MNKKRWGALAIAVLLFGVSIIVNFASLAFTTDFTKFFEETFTTSDENFSEEVMEDGDEFKKIAILEVDGVIQDTGSSTSLLKDGSYNHRDFMKQLNYVKDNNDVKAVILRVNSPGGGVVESAEIHDKIVEIQKEAKKPVYVSMGATAASGGYYISTSADKIFASKETMTGSLGVIMQGVNYSELAKDFGVDFVTIKSGPYKDIMSPSRKMTNDEKKIIQNMVNNSYDGFVQVISQGRHMPENIVRKLADGRVYDGRQAKELKLIDDFGYLEDVIDHVRKDFHLKNAQVVRYKSDAGLGSLFSMAAQKMMGKEADVTGLMKMLSQPNAPRLMYIYSE
ncbi:signal peptide peptidase SppA [Heyndrickxia sporothermodurans]|uniref:signal peptide peptidase SppA n=1 Tax=Heyndrickxia sporothermodurans TaxID=46224 RepID=UPI002E248872|nr:signal peptide peptidase SppA [Heyndrickxia sporothermodurans]MED3653528.1 signal peptide peptidase SppA [Heyndrickxia sporothermodurans]